MGLGPKKAGCRPYKLGLGRVEPIVSLVIPGISQVPTRSRLGEGSRAAKE